MTNTFANDPSLQALRINDFTPGIISYGRGLYPSVRATTAPLGSASTAVRCVARPGVGLVPLPSRAKVIDLAPAGPVYTPATVPVLVTAIKALGGLIPGGTSQLPQSEALSDFLFVALNYQINGTQRRTEVHRIITGTSLDQIIWTLPPDTTLTPAHGFAMSIGRVLNSAGETAVPTVAMAQSFKQVFRLAPDAINYTGGTAPDISPDFTAASGLEAIHAIFSHEFRHVFFCGTLLGVGTSGQLLAHVDDITYTDPPMSATVYQPPAGNNLPFFDPEDYSSLGAFGSINSGELMIVRQGQGGFMIDGDLTEPSVTKLPGIRGTGRLIQQGQTTPIGMVYLSELDGAWAWNGSNVAQKISTQIPDDALQRATTNPSGTLLNFYQLDGLNAYNEVWGPWVLFSHNWLYDTDLKSWWRIEDTGTVDLEVYSRANQNNRICWAMVGQADGLGGTCSLHLFDRFLPAKSWQWVSNPLTPYLGVYTNIMMVEILATNPGTSVATVTIWGTSQTGYDSAPLTFTLPANSHVRLSGRLGYNSPDPQINVNATGTVSDPTSPAPTLHEIILGCQRAAPTGPQ